MAGPAVAGSVVDKQVQTTITVGTEHGTISILAPALTGGLDLLSVDGAAPSPITRGVWPR